VVLSGALVCMTATLALAQTPTTTTETKKFQIIAVDGNQLVVRLPEGTRELTVPDDFRFNVDGNMLSVQELKPGMSGSATITTKTTLVPVTVTEIKKGTVVHTTGSSIIVRTESGVKSFTQSDIDKRGVKIMREGKPATISDFRANDQLTATIITTKPPQVLTERQVQATLAKSGGAPPPPQNAPAAAAPPSTPAPAPSVASTSGTAPKTLPKTASPRPALALAGLASLAVGIVLTMRRRRAAH
jgi:LPXTG-motif cell wall-anchored protein